MLPPILIFGASSTQPLHSQLGADLRRGASKPGVSFRRIGTESLLEDKQPRSAIHLMAGRMLSPQRQVDKELPPAGAARL
jgi:hypothetical protein